jgi:nuclear transport factor 2 (NTF2) superfamily protein
VAATHAPTQMRRRTSSVMIRVHSYGNENWEFDEHGLIIRREASINDCVIDESDRRIFGPPPEAERGQDIPLH